LLQVVEEQVVVTIEVEVVEQVEQEFYKDYQHKEQLQQ
jgi:hypothetical protein